MDALEAAKIVVLVFSKDAQESEYVNNEIDAAFSNNMHIVSLKVDDTFPKNRMEFFLKNTQWLDASPKNLKEKDLTLEDCYEQLVVDVKRILESEEASQAPIHSQSQVIPQKEKKFFEKNGKLVILGVIALVAVLCLAAFTFMNGESGTGEDNETLVSIGYIGMEDYGNNHAYYVFGNVAENLTSSSCDVIHIDYYDNGGKVVETTDTKVGDVEGNILGSVEDSNKDIKNVSLELKDKNGKVLYNVSSNNVINQ